MDAYWPTSDKGSIATAHFPFKIVQINNKKNQNKTKTNQTKQLQ